MRRNLLELSVLRLIMLALFLLVLAAGLHDSALRLQDLPAGLYVVLGLFLLLNLLTLLRLAQRAPVRDDELFLQLLADWLLLTGLFQATGGSNNPFVTYYLVPLAIAASSLPRRQTLTVAAAAILSITWLTWWPPSSTGLAWPWHSYQGHLWGMWASFIISVLVLAVFLGRLQARLWAQGRELARQQRHLLQRQQMAAMGALAADAVHELATPLSSLTLLVDELGPDAAAAPEVVPVLRTQLQRCRDILERLRTQARTPENSPCQTLQAHLQPVLHQLRTQFPDIDFRVAWQDLGECTVAMPWLLRQLLWNALRNAAEAAERQVVLAIDREPAQWRFQVRDDGPGFPETVLQAYQALAGSLPSAKPQGLGLGLYLARQTVVELGGELRLSNPADGGACVRVLLPLHALEA